MTDGQDVATLYEPATTKVLSFGSSAAWTDEFPNDSCKIMLSDNDVAISGINFKTTSDDYKYMSGSQLEYSDSNMSPLFESEGGSAL